MDDLSLKMLLLLAAGLSLWKLYGFMHAHTIIITAIDISLMLLLPQRLKHHISYAARILSRVKGKSRRR